MLLAKSIIKFTQRYTLLFNKSYSKLIFANKNRTFLVLLFLYKFYRIFICFFLFKRRAKSVRLRFFSTKHSTLYTFQASFFKWAPIRHFKILPKSSLSNLRIVGQLINQQRQQRKNAICLQLSAPTQDSQNSWGWELREQKKAAVSAN